MRLYEKEIGGPSVGTISCSAVNSTDAFNIAAAITDRMAAGELEAEKTVFSTTRDEMLKVHSRRASSS